MGTEEEKKDSRMRKTGNIWEILHAVKVESLTALTLILFFCTMLSSEFGKGPIQLRFVISTSNT